MYKSDDRNPQPLFQRLKEIERTIEVGFSSDRRIMQMRREAQKIRRTLERVTGTQLTTQNQDSDTEQSNALRESAQPSKTWDELKIPPSGSLRGQLSHLRNHYGITQQHGALDQHFLAEMGPITVMVEAAKIVRNDTVLEIGPGLGQITRAILAKGAKVFTIELDGSFRPVLDALQSEFRSDSTDKLDTVYGSALDRSIRWPKACRKLVSNLPFGILEPFMLRLASESQIAQVTLLVGKDFYERTLESPAVQGRSASLANSLFKIELIAEVERDNFEPEPRTTCVILNLTRKKGGSEAGVALLCRAIAATPRASVSSILQTAIAITSSRLIRQGSFDDIPDINQLGVSKDILNRRLQDLDNSAFSKVAQALRAASTSIRHSGKQLRNQDSLEDGLDEE